MKRKTKLKNLPVCFAALACVSAVSFADDVAAFKRQATAYMNALPVKATYKLIPKIGQGYNEISETLASTCIASKTDTRNTGVGSFSFGSSASELFQDHYPNAKLHGLIALVEGNGEKAVTESAARYINSRGSASGSHFKNLISMLLKVKSEQIAKSPEGLLPEVEKISGILDFSKRCGNRYVSVIDYGVTVNSAIRIDASDDVQKKISGGSLTSEEGVQELIADGVPKDTQLTLIIYQRGINDAKLSEYVGVPFKEGYLEIPAQVSDAPKLMEIVTLVTDFLKTAVPKDDPHGKFDPKLVPQTVLGFGYDEYIHFDGDSFFKKTLHRPDAVKKFVGWTPFSFELEEDLKKLVAMRRFFDLKSSYFLSGKEMETGAESLRRSEFTGALAMVPIFLKSILNVEKDLEGRPENLKEFQEVVDNHSERDLESIQDSVKAEYWRDPSEGL